MELGERLRQARLEAGLSQRQLCGEEVTRNMLSQIENGSARPSMDTLRYFAARLGKPMGYFLEEQTVVSPNPAVMTQARQAQGEERLRLLQQYRGPDPVFDQERWLLEVLACLEAAEQAIREGRQEESGLWLEKAKAAGQSTIYYTPELERRRLLLCYESHTAPAEQLAAQLQDNLQELLLRAEAALKAEDPNRCLQLLDAAGSRPAQWYVLRGEAQFAKGDYAAAAEAYRQAEGPAVYARLEQCYKELEDYKMAYHYACKQR